MQNRSAGIVTRNNSLLLMKRTKFGHIYYVIPGGGVKKDESFKDAAIRELYEETRIKAEIIRLLYRHEFDTGKTQEYYLMKHISGSPRLEDSEELLLTNKNNTFEPLFVPIEELSSLPLLPPSLKKNLLADLPNSLPENPKTLKLFEKKEFSFFKEFDKIEKTKT